MQTRCYHTKNFASAKQFHKLLHKIEFRKNCREVGDSDCTVTYFYSFALMLDLP